MSEIPSFNRKIKPNELCPCGSKKKYKKCHGNSSANQTLNPYQLDGQIRSLRVANKCLAPDTFSHECSKGIINAHTISRSGSLGAIEKNGHVYSYQISIQSLIKSSGQLHPELTGWRKASTFPGFCGYHDKKLFEPLEDRPFSGSKEQCFLLAYRCISRELFTKKTSDHQSKFRQIMAGNSAHKAQYISDFNLGVELGLRDSYTHKTRYDAVLQSKDWDAIHAVIVEFDGVFPIQCAGGYFPDIDIFGNKIQVIGLAKSTPDAITLISFAAEGISYLCFCWLDDSDKSCSAFISSINQVPKDDLPIILASVLLQFSENCHFSPNWYDNLPIDGKSWCAEQISVGTSAFKSAPPPVKNAGFSYLSDVKIRSITTVK